MTLTPKARTKDPDAVLDYVFDWSDWLDGDTLLADPSGHTITAPDVTVDSSSNTSTQVTVWLSGGTVDTKAEVTCHVTTTAGRQEDRTLTLFIRER